MIRQLMTAENATKRKGAPKAHRKRTAQMRVWDGRMKEDGTEMVMHITGKTCCEM